MVSYLFPDTDIDMTALSVAAAIFLSAIVLQAETKTEPTMMTMVTMNETRHGKPSTQPFDPHPREGKG